MESFRIDFEDAAGKHAVRYFDENRAAAMRTARSLSRKGLVVYMIRAVGSYGEGFEDSGQVVFSEGRIIWREGVTEGGAKC